MTQVEHKKETHVRYSRKIRIELKEELDRWLERRQAMLVLGIENAPDGPKDENYAGVKVDDQTDRVKRLSAELESSDAARKELADELTKAGIEISKLRNERRSESNPGLTGSENIVLRKRIAELEAELKAKPVSADARQMKMLTDAALKADEEIARLKAEIVRKDYWFEHTPIEDKAKKGWVMYFQLKKAMEAKGQFDQEAAS